MLKRRLEIGLAILALFTMVGCIAGGEKDDDGNGQIGGRTRREELKAYEVNRAKWQSHKIDDYFFKVNMGCFCYPMGWMQVTVEDGQAVKYDSVPGKGDYYDTTYAGNAPTVETLFQSISSYLSDEEYDVSVEYDAKLGFPRKIDARHLTPLPDADAQVEIVELAPL
jgi:hypothetical protein